MRFTALAADYDGTLAADGLVSTETLGALERLRHSGRRILLVTGRRLDDLGRVFPGVDRFDRVVAENGAVIHRPETGAVRALGPAPPAVFVAALRRRGVEPLSIGRVIVATWEPHQTAVLETIRELGLGLQVVFNKGAVMVLPRGVDKASGLRAALDEVGIAPRDTVGVGDAENDHAFLSLCGFAAAVADALPAVKERADWVATKPRGEGVRELIDCLLKLSRAGEATP
jgi:HAD superfamily hydrolase (TIGR01484 family)